jgi:hypothetical protein
MERRCQPILLAMPVTELGDRHLHEEDVVNKPMKSPMGGSSTGTVDSVADILGRELATLIEEWLARVEKEPDLMSVPLSDEERSAYIPHVIQDITGRLRLDAGAKAPISKIAANHAVLRRRQGYSVAMLVEESRLLQVSIFTTLHKNVKQLDFDALLPDVVTIADEVDAQLKEQMLGFVAAGVGSKSKNR